MDCEIGPEEFWNYSPLEIGELMESYYRRKRLEAKQRITHDFIMAEVQARYLFREKDKDIPHVWEYYPNLFEAEKQAYLADAREKELEACKEARRVYAAEFNRRRQSGS